MKAKPEKWLPHQFVPSRISLDSIRIKSLPNQKNGIYGHGKERYDKNGSYFLTMRKFTPVMLHGRL